jgi:hypothetical protein
LNDITLRYIGVDGERGHLFHGLQEGLDGGGKGALQILHFFIATHQKEITTPD